MKAIWGHVSEISFGENRKIDKLKEHIKEHTTGELKNISPYTTHHPTAAIKVILKSEEKFFMGQISTQCGWIVVGKLSNGKNKDFSKIVEVAVELAKLCTYGGIIINSSLISEEKVLDKYGFRCIFKNTLGSLYYRDLEQPVEESEDEDYWEEYDE